MKMVSGYRSYSHSVVYYINCNIIDMATIYGSIIIIGGKNLGKSSFMARHLYVTTYVLRF